MSYYKYALLASVFLSGTAVSNDRNQSAFLKLGSDVQISGTTAVNVLNRTISVAGAVRVFAVADGRYFAVDAPAGSVRIAIDGNESYSSHAVTDWGSSSNSVQHSFNVLAVADLSPGTHTIAMRASAHPSRPGRFKVGSGSSLSVLVQPLSAINVQSLAGESAHINLTTYNPGAGIDVVEGGSNRPTVSILSQNITNNLPQATKIVSLIAGRAFHSCNSGISGGKGDALWGIWEGSSCQSTSSASWSVNDIDNAAELQAPMYAHAVHSLGIGQTKNVSFRASELAFGSDQSGSPSGAHENGVCYKVGSAKLVSASGGVVMGSASGGASSFCSTYTWKCVATTQGSPGCPSAGTEVPIGSAVVNIPGGHDGIVYFSAKTRIQADNSDSFATATLGIKVDGANVGSAGVQQLAQGVGQASRTLSSSYLSAPQGNSSRLTPGSHTVQVYIKVDGTNLKWPSVPQDIVLTYFD